MEQYQLAVIGAGPGGYVAAIKAAQLGLKTVVVEGGQLGGTCLNRGCIPTKTLLHSATAYCHAQHLEELGIQASGIGYDIEKIHRRKKAVSAKLREGVEGLFKSNRIALVRGMARITAPHTIQVLGEETCSITAENILIAAGGQPVRPNIPGMELPGVMNSEEFLAVEDRVFPRLTIVGGGVIGVELGSVYAALGCQVTILEAADRILPRMDREISQNLSMILKKRGVTIHTGATLEKITQQDGLTCHFIKKGESQQAAGDGVLVAIGRKANILGLFGQGMEPEVEKGFLKVDENFATSIPGVYAVGDVIGGALAHQASAQGICAAERIAGQTPTVDLSCVPACVYTQPEIASVGITADDAKREGREVLTGKFIMSANGKSIIDDQERGFIKVVFDKETQVLLGAQLMCGRATDLVTELSAAITYKLTQSQLASVIRPHPTFGEGITEAVEDAVGHGLHIAPPRRR